MGTACYGFRHLLAQNDRRNQSRIVDLSTSSSRAISRVGIPRAAISRAVGSSSSRRLDPFRFPRAACTWLNPDAVIRLCVHFATLRAM